MLTEIKNGNVVRIEGVLSEINLKEFSYKKGGVGESVNAISGSIKVRVDTKINNEDVTLEIPVHMFANQFTAAGQPSKAYDNAKDIITNYVSIAASDYETADRVKITGAAISMNEYYDEGGRFFSFPRVRANFVNRIRKEECKPTADFSVTFMVGKKGYVLDADGVETDTYKVTGMIPTYGGKVDIVPFLAINPGVIDAVSSYWNEGDTVKATGKLKFSSKTETHFTPVDFGDPIETVRTVSVSDLIITGGSSTPLDGEFAINENDMKEALVAHKAYLEDLKSKKAKKKQAPSPASAKDKFADLGF